MKIAWLELQNNARMKLFSHLKTKSNKFFEDNRKKLPNSAKANHAPR